MLRSSGDIKTVPSRPRLALLAVMFAGIMPATAASGETSLSRECRSAATTRIPVQIVSNLPFMSGRVNGSPPLNVILDSGAALSVVAPDVAALIGLKSAGSLEAGGFGHGSSQTLHLVDAAVLTWGADSARLRLAGQQVAILPINYIGSQTGHQTDALFGSNVFQNFRVTLDYGQESVSFAPLDAPCKPSTAAIPIQVSGNVPIVEASLMASDGSVVKAMFVVDIGTTGAMILSKRFMDEHPGLAAGHKWAASPPVTAVGGTIDFKLLRLSAVQIGGFKLDGPVAAVPEQAAGILAVPGIAGLIGGEILRRFDVTWDYRSSQMWLVPNARLHERFEADASGLHLVAKGAKLTDVYVDAVLPGSPADRAGVLVGDRVEALNGRQLPLWKMGRSLMRAGSWIEIAIMRQGQTRRLRFRLENAV